METPTNKPRRTKKKTTITLNEGTLIRIISILIMVAIIAFLFLRLHAR